MTKVRHTSRKRFIKWLREIVDSQEINGVFWLDKEKTIFRVPWTRVDSPEFDLARDAMLFQKWAEFTGRWRMGERTDPSVWKTRFRCAIRKMSEIEEVKTQTNLDDTNGQQPFRVFRFKSEGESQQPKKGIKRKCRYRSNSQRMVRKRHCTTQLYHGQICTTARQIKQGVVLDGVTQRMTQSLTGGNDFAAPGVMQIDGTVTPNVIEQCMMQNQKTVSVNSGMAVTQSRNFGIEMSGLTSSAMQDCTISCNTGTNFEMGVTQYLGFHRSSDMTATFVNTPWPNQIGIDKEFETCEANPSNLPRISLQDINNILLQDYEPSLAPQGDLAHMQCTPYSVLQSSFEDGRGIKSNCYNGQMFEDQGSQEAKAYNNSIIFNDLNEIFQQTPSCLPNSSGQEAIEIPNQQDCLLQTLNIEYPALSYQCMA